MGQMTISLTDEAELKLRKDAKDNRRTISKQIEHLLYGEGKSDG